MPTVTGVIQELMANVPSGSVCANIGSAPNNAEIVTVSLLSTDSAAVIAQKLAVIALLNTAYSMGAQVSYEWDDSDADSNVVMLGPPL
jgi:hypothetical protein